MPSSSTNENKAPDLDSRGWIRDRMESTHSSNIHQSGSNHNSSTSSLRNEDNLSNQDLNSEETLKSNENSSSGTIKGTKNKDGKSSWMKSLGKRTLRLRKEKAKNRDLNAIVNDLTQNQNDQQSASSVNTNSNQIANTSSSSPKLTRKSSEKFSKSSLKKVIGNGTNSSNGPATTTTTTSTSISKDSQNQKTQHKQQRGGEIIPDKQDPARFIGDGISFKAKLIGVLEVNGPRGDQICQQALSELKMAIKAAGEHKQKIIIHISISGLRLRDEKTGDCLYHHPVHKISFIAQDLTDTRAFGYIFGSPDMGHRFFGLKTEKSASQVVIAMRDLFQVVFDLKKKEIERAKQQLEIQQKFLATRAVENAPSKITSIAETYIEGACALKDKPTGTNRSDGGEEADLLNLEVELSILENNIGNLGESSKQFRNSTTSISSDPMNQQKPSTSKQHSFGFGMMGESMGFTDSFGDFDPFDTSSTANKNYKKFDNSSSSPFTADPFFQVDPFSHLEKNEDPFFTSDPFENSGPNSATGGGQSEPAFTFDSSKLVSEDVGLSSSKLYRSSLNDSGSGERQESQAQASEMKKSEDSQICNNKNQPSWAASFEDNFVPTCTSINSTTTGGSTDLFRDLDPLRIGKVKPIIDKKDFFNDLKNPQKQVIDNFYPNSHSINSNNNNDTSTRMPSLAVIELPPPPSSKSLSPKMSHLSSTTSTTQMTNSFSSNFAPQSSSNSDFENHFKTTSNNNNKSGASSTCGSSELPRRFKERSDSPPNYSPPPPPLYPAGSSATNSEYFTTILPPPNRTISCSSASSTASGSSFRNNNSNKKSQQILKQMTIVNTSSSGSNLSPKTLPKNSKFSKNYTIDISNSSIEEIPNLTPPPRPSAGTKRDRYGKIGGLQSSGSISSTRPRPNSGGSNRKNYGYPPEPPPRPIETTLQQPHFIPAPPLPPKKTAANNSLNLSGHNNNANNTMTNSFSQFSGSGGSCSIEGFSKELYPGERERTRRTLSVESHNDLPLPLPSRRPGNNRYSILPLQTTSIVTGGSPQLHRKDLSSTKNMSMEEALNQVSELSLGQLASKLDIPVTALSNFTIQQLAEKLLKIKIDNNEQPVKRCVSELGFESNFDMLPPRRISNNFESQSTGIGGQFDDDDDISNSFSAVTAPANLQRTSIINTMNESKQSYDRYAVFRDLDEVGGGGGFSVFCADSNSTLKVCEKHDSRDSSSERTLHASEEKLGAGGNNQMNTMDDITDANLSDEPLSMMHDEFPPLENTLDNDNGDDISIVSNKGEWATFETTFENEFVIPKNSDCAPLVEEEDNFNLNHNKQILAADDSTDSDTKILTPLKKGEFTFNDNIDDNEEYKKVQDVEIEHSFKRQSSGSSKHSGGGHSSGGHSRNDEYSSRYNHNYHNSGTSSRRDGRKFRDHRDREEKEYNSSSRTRHSPRCDSRNSYSSTSRARRYEQEDSDSPIDFAPSDQISSKRIGSGGSSSASRRRHDNELYEDENDRSHRLTHQQKKSRRYHSKYYQHQGGPSSDRNKDYYYSSRKKLHGHHSPERYSNHESEESIDDDGNRKSASPSNARRREREYYQRERDYLERHHRRPNSGGSSRANKDSPRSSTRNRYKYPEDEEFEDSKELSDYSDSESRRYGHRHHHRHKRHSHHSTSNQRNYFTPSQSDSGSPSPSYHSEQIQPTSGTTTGNNKKSKSILQSPSGFTSKDNFGEKPRRRSFDQEEHQQKTQEHHYKSRHRPSSGSASGKYKSDLSLNNPTSMSTSTLTTKVVMGSGGGIKLSEFRGCDEDNNEASSHQQQRHKQKDNQNQGDVDVLRMNRDRRVEKRLTRPSSVPNDTTIADIQGGGFAFEDNFVKDENNSVFFTTENDDDISKSLQIDNGQKEIDRIVKQEYLPEVPKRRNSSSASITHENNKKLDSIQSQSLEEEEVEVPAEANNCTTKQLSEENEHKEQLEISLNEQEQQEQKAIGVCIGIGGSSINSNFKKLSSIKEDENTTATTTTESKMTKSPSLNIFKVDSDPFADDDFFS